MTSHRLARGNKDIPSTDASITASSVADLPDQIDRLMILLHK